MADAIKQMSLESINARIYPPPALAFSFLVKLCNLVMRVQYDVPEPSGIFLLSLGGVLLVFRRRPKSTAT